MELLLRPKDYLVHFDFPNPPELSPPIIGIHKVSFQYQEDHQWIFQELELGIDLSSRIAIVGNNGSGKSTLLKLLIGELKPTIGEVTKNHRAKIGYFSQHSADQLGGEKNGTDYLIEKFDLKYQEARKLLGTYGLESKAHQIKMSSLSGGQKARVCFAAMTMSYPDVIILDEPTNNLDIESIDALIEAINQYQGGVVLVSHDARLITSTNCQLYVCHDQNCLKYDGDFDDYRQELLEELEE